MNNSNFLSYFVKTFFIGFLLFSLLALFDIYNPIIFIIFIGALTVWGLSMPFFMDYCQKKYLKIYKKKYKDIDFVYKNMSLAPHPGTSLLSDLEMTGISVGDIKSMLLMTCNLWRGCEYYDQKLRAQLKHVNIDMYGFGACEKVNSNITLYPVSKVLIEHENIITTKSGRVFVYYEPSHIFKNCKDILKDGAYLFEVMNNNQQFKQSIVNKLENLRLVA